MKRKLLIMALGVLVTFGIVRAAVTFVAKPTRAGTLAEVIGDRLMEIDSLVVEGPINAGDFPVMRKATWDGNLSVVNLEKALIDGDSIPAKAFNAYVTWTMGDVYASYTYKTKLKRVLLPNTIKEIGDSAFHNARWLRTINLPDSLERLGDNAFCVEENSLEGGGSAYSVLKMDSLIFPKKLRYIGSGAFSDCHNVSGKIVLPEHVNIGLGAFSGTNISSIEFPDEIGEDIDGAFANMFWLEEVRIPEHYPQISASYLFDGCLRLKKITIPDSWTYLPKGFLYITGVEEIKLPSHLVYLEEEALYHCDGLKSIAFPKGFTAMGDYALEGCRGLESVEFPEGFSSMGEGALSYCLSLKSIELPEGFTTLGKKALYDSDLKSISLPSTLKYISDRSMSGLPGLKEIECRAVSAPEVREQTDEPFSYVDYYTNPTNDSAILYVPKGSLESYRNSCWNYFKDIREKDFNDSGVEGIGADSSEGNGTTYDLMGRKVSTPVAGGIYIRNGRKIIVK